MYDSSALYSVRRFRMRPYRHSSNGDDCDDDAVAAAALHDVVEQYLWNRCSSLPIYQRR